MRSFILLSSILLFCGIHVNGQQNVACAPSSSQYVTWTSLYGTSTTLAGPINISGRRNVILNVNNLRVNGGITIEAGSSLTFDWQRHITLTVPFIIVQGTLNIGSESCPYENKADILLIDGGRDLTVDGMASGRKGIIVGSGGSINLHGAKGRSGEGSWTTLASDAAVGATTLTLASNVASATQRTRQWSVGDRIVLASTDYNPAQTETLTIRAVRSANVIEVQPALRWRHFGRVTNGVDERAEVALLTRNILIRGQKDSARPTFGGHFMIHRGFARARIEGVEFDHMGQDIIGRYPVHFHTFGVAPAGTYVRFNSVHHSNFRCFTFHASESILVESNVCFDIRGHAYYLEDGVEQRIQFRRNLAVLIRTKTSGERLGSDSSAGLSAFWITNPNNEFTGNVAAGVYGTGFWIHTRNGPRADSFTMGTYRNVNPSTTPLLAFNRNKAHSAEFGFQIEATFFDGGDVPKNPGAPMVSYAPRRNGQREPPIIREFTGYKIHDRAIWARTESIGIVNSFFADNWVGVEVATSGSHPPAPSMQWVNNTVFVGASENIGNSADSGTIQYWDSRMGMAFPRRGDGFIGFREYDGGQGCSNCRFINYRSYSGDSKIHTAIGARRSNNNQVATTNLVRTSTFTNCARKHYVFDRSGDGGKTTSIRDVDGSISGRRGTVLPNLGLYRTNRCITNSEYGMVCPHRYVNMWVLDMQRSNAGGSRLRITRNQRPTSQSVDDTTMTLSGFVDFGRHRYQPIVSPGASYLVSFSGTTSPKLAFEIANGEQGDIVNLAICYPTGTTISRVYRGLANANGSNLLPTIGSATTLSTTSSRTAVTENNYFWDSRRGMLFIRVRQRNTRTNYGNFCPNGGCDFVWVDANIPSGAASRNCYDVAYGSDSIQQTSGGWLDTNF